MDRRQGQSQRELCRRGLLASLTFVGATLHEFDVVVAEPPEESLGSLERSRVVVLTERVGGLAHGVGDARQHRTVDVVGHHRIGARHGEPEHELAGVEQLGGQLAADLHLLLAERGVHAGPRRSRPIAHGIASELLEQVDRCDDVALRLRHLLAVGVEDPSGQRDVRPRKRVVLEVRAHHRAEQPGANDVVSLRSQVHGENAREQIRVVLPTAGDLGRERRRGPRVHHVGITGETTGHVALVGGEPRGHVGGGVDGQRGLVGNDRPIVDGFAVLVELVPDGNRHTEVALSTDQPVAVQSLDPVRITMPHVIGMPDQLVAPTEHGGAQVCVASAIADVPLTAGDDLERAIALLEELHRMRDRPRLTEHGAALAQRFHDLVLGLIDEQPGDLFVRGEPFGGIESVGRCGDDASVATDDGARGQIQFAPPNDVGDVAEGADHGDAGSLVGLGQRVGHDRNLDAIQRRAHLRSEQRLVALVVGVRHQSHACRDQDGARGVDDDVTTAVDAGEGDLVIRAGSFAILEFGLGDRGFEVDVPQRGCLLRVGLATSQIAQERALTRASAALVDGGVQQRPIHGQSEPSEQILEDLLVLVGELLAQLDEVGSRNGHRLMILGRITAERRLETGDVGDVGVASHTEEVLDASLGGQTVVVPTHRVEDRLARHALEAGDGVRVGVREDVTHVQRTTHRGRGSVDRVHAGPFRGSIEGVGSLALPYARPLALDSVE